MSRNKNPLGFLKTTAVGGLLFLLPLIVAGALIGQMVPIVNAIASALAGILPGTFKTPGGIALLVLLSIVVLLLLCFIAGLIARRSLGRSLSGVFEKKLVMLFPRYAIIKDQMADTLGGKQVQTQMHPVLVRFDDRFRVGFETERDEATGVAAVYLPGSPDPWAGHVALVDIERVQSVPVEFCELAATCEQLGRGSTRLLIRSE